MWVSEVRKLAAELDRLAVWTSALASCSQVLPPTLTGTGRASLFAMLWKNCSPRKFRAERRPTFTMHAASAVRILRVLHGAREWPDITSTS